MRFAAVLLVLLLPTAGAFTSAPPGNSVHDDITAVATDAGWSDGGTKALQEAVRAPDYEETKLDPDGKEVDVDATDAYRPDHHCDRTPGTADGDAFEATVGYIHQQRSAAANFSAAGQSKEAVQALGRALHALQDCYSHSNIVDLPDKQHDHEQALLHYGPAVPGLRLASFLPDAEDPERPPGDDYPHGDKNKDSAKSTPEAELLLDDGRSKFEHAEQLARMATVAFLQEFTQSLGEQERKGIMDVKTEDNGLPDDLNVPALPMAWVLVAIAFAALPWRRR